MQTRKTRWTGTCWRLLGERLGAFLRRRRAFANDRPQLPRPTTSPRVSLRVQRGVQRGVQRRRSHDTAVLLATDRTPIKTTYNRMIRDNWSEPGQAELNLRRELSDLRPARTSSTATRPQRFVRSRREPSVGLARSGCRRCSYANSLSYVAGTSTQPSRPRGGSVRRRPPRRPAPVGRVNERGDFHLKTFAFRR